MRKSVLAFFGLMILIGGIAAGFAVAARLTDEVEAAGPVKTFGYYRVLSVATTIPSDNVGVERLAICDVGDKALGGGWEHATTTAVTHVRKSETLTDERFWQVVMEKRSGPTVSNFRAVVRGPHTVDH